MSLEPPPPSLFGPPDAEMSSAMNEPDATNASLSVRKL